MSLSAHLLHTVLTGNTGRQWAALRPSLHSWHPWFVAVSLQSLLPDCSVSSCVNHISIRYKLLMSPRAKLSSSHTLLVVVREQMTPHLQVMIDHTHNRPWFPSRLAKEITSITLLPSSQDWPWFDPWVLISLSAWISHQHPSLSMCPCCCFSITLGLWACLSFSFGWPSRT